VAVQGVSLIKQLRFYGEIEIFATADEALERTERIHEIESFEGRPEVDRT
jgi:hypothetical protein